MQHPNSSLKYVSLHHVCVRSEASDTCFLTYICFQKQLFILREEKVILQRSDFYQFLFMEQAFGIL